MTVQDPGESRGDNAYRSFASGPADGLLPSLSSQGFSMPDDLPDAIANAPELDERSRRALEALVDARWRLDTVPDDLKPSAARALQLLSRLNPALPPQASGNESSLAARTLDRIFSSDHAHLLSPADADAADAWVQAGYDASRVPAHLAHGAAQHERLANLLRTPSADARAAANSGLAARTARLIDLVDAEAQDDLAPIPISRGAWLRRRAWDVVAAAAMLLVAASIMWPVLAGMRQRSMELQCSSNMQAVASAMSAYAGEHQDSLPVVLASFGPQRWWDVNSSRPVANSSNLFTLVKNGYAKLASLACPGNPSAAVAQSNPTASDWDSLDQISYSYQLMSGRPQSHWSQSDRRLILADRSPAVLRAVKGQRPVPSENSPNHHGLGQHGLFTDGSAQWLSSSCIRGSSGIVDCIWLPRPAVFQVQDITIEGNPQDNELFITLTGRELPADGSDVFLGP